MRLWYACCCWCKCAESVCSSCQRHRCRAVRWYNALEAAVSLTQKPSTGTLAYGRAGLVCNLVPLQPLLRFGMASQCQPHAAVLTEVWHRAQLSFLCGEFANSLAVYQPDITLRLLRGSVSENECLPTQKPLSKGTVLNLMCWKCLSFPLIELHHCPELSARQQQGRRHEGKEAFPSIRQKNFM
jgi:hypothetical protein